MSIASVILYADDIILHTCRLFEEEKWEKVPPGSGAVSFCSSPSVCSPAGGLGCSVATIVCGAICFFVIVYMYRFYSFAGLQVILLFIYVSLKQPTDAAVKS